MCSNSGGGPVKNWPYLEDILRIPVAAWGGEDKTLTLFKSLIFTPTMYSHSSSIKERFFSDTMPLSAQKMILLILNRRDRSYNVRGQLK